jgi:iron-sulfur cluster assembly accessory protein
MTNSAERQNPEAELLLTDEAIQQVKRLLARDKHDGYGLRVSVANGGCSGFSYQLKFEKEPAPEDIVLVRGGLNIYVDSASAVYLKGTVIDFVAGIYGGGFKFSNPNATGTCGCGTSFST